MKFLFRISRWFHKWLGLLLILYGVLMGISGIFVNHHEWIEGLSVPRWLVPPQYHPVDFDRHALVQAEFSSDDPDQVFVAGSAGVWASSDGGYTFEPMDDGFPEAPAHRVTNAVLLIEEADTRLLAGTAHGLYACDPADGRWSELALGDGHAHVRSILRVRDSVLVFTRSGIWESPVDARPLRFERIDASRRIDPERGAPGVSLVFLLFDLHSGEVLGLSGRLIVDVVGVLTVFLCFSAFYLWYYPKQRKWTRNRPRRRPKRKKADRWPRRKVGQTLFRSLFHYHLKLGIWIAPILLLLSATGFFMRPPLLILPAMVDVPAALYPGLPPAEVWEERINRAVHDHARGRILIEASDGFWAAPDDDLDRPFEQVEMPAPVHVMGTMALETDPSGDLIVGSFSGGFRIDRETSAVTDMFTGEQPEGVSTMRTADRMVTGVFHTPGGEEYASTFHNGLLRAGGEPRAGRFEMPKQLTERYRMPLWDYMFELHNGRFFRDWIGQWYLLVPIVGSLLFLLLTVTGIFDWLMIRLVLPRAHRRRRGERDSSADAAAG